MVKFFLASPKYVDNYTKYFQNLNFKTISATVLFRRGGPTILGDVHGVVGLFVEGQPLVVDGLGARATVDFGVVRCRSVSARGLTTDNHDAVPYLKRKDFQ